MNYKMNISKNMNFLTVEISNKDIPEEMIKEFKDNKIIYDENIIHFKMGDSNSTLNPLSLFPKALMIIGKY